MDYTVQLPYLGQWRQVVVRGAKTQDEALYTARARYRCGPYATLQVWPGAAPDVNEVCTPYRLVRRRAMWFGVATICILGVLGGIVSAAVSSGPPPSPIVPTAHAKR